MKILDRILSKFLSDEYKSASNRADEFMLAKHMYQQAIQDAVEECGYVLDTLDRAGSVDIGSGPQEGAERARDCELRGQGVLIVMDRIRELCEDEVAEDLCGFCDICKGPCRDAISTDETVPG